MLNIKTYCICYIVLRTIISTMMSIKLFTNSMYKEEKTASIALCPIKT